MRRGGVVLFVMALCLVPTQSGMARQELASPRDSGLQILSQDAEELILDVRIPPIELQDVTLGGQTFQRLQMSAAGHTTEVGWPELPVFARYVAVPIGAEVAVELLDAQRTVESDVLVYPAQPPMPDSTAAQEGPLSFDEAFYQQDTIYPRLPVEAGVPGRLRDVRYVLIRFHPAQYNPARRELTVYSSMRVRVTFQGGESRFTTAGYRAQSFERMYRGLFVNYDSLEPAALRPMGASDRDGADLLIITAPDFRRPALDLADWKTRRGIPTAVVTTDETGTSAVEIQSYIQVAYNTWSPPPAYVLLLGDAEFIPVHYVTEHPYYGGPRTGTDLYYFTTSGTDYMPDIAGARIPASTEGEARRVVDNILSYEQDPPADSTFYDRFQVASYFQDDDDDGIADRLFAQTSEEIHDYLEDTEGKTATRCYTTNSASPQYYYDGSTVPAEVQTALLLKSDRTCITSDLNDGRFILNHRDHGNSYSWSDPEYLSRDVRGLSYTDPDELPVVFSINCETAWFDAETDDEGCAYAGATSIAEEFLMQEKAVAVFGASRVSYSWYNDVLMKGYYDGIWSGMLPGFGAGAPFSDEVYRLGDAMGWGKAYLLTQYPPPNLYTLTTMEIHHLLGDPTLEIWTEVPQSMTVSHAATASVGATSFSVNVDVADARITLVQNGDIVGEVASSVAGANSVPLNPAADHGPLHVTVTKHNYRPYQGAADVGDTHTVSGCITDGGSGVADLWVAFGADLPAARTDASGCFSQKLADGTYTVAPVEETWRIWPADRQVTLSGSDVTNVDFEAEPQRVTAGYSEGFELGRLGPAWTVGGDGFGRSEILDCPNSGDYALIFDQTDWGQYATAASVLSVDLSCRSDATLSFWWRDNLDESNAEDGVFIRRNTSDTWCNAFTFPSYQSTYIQQTIDLNAAAQSCWGSSSLTSDFQIMFQQRDNFRWTGDDGIAVDDISITASGQMFTWDGSTDSDWNDGTNWDVGCVPSAVDDVVIPGTGVSNWPDANTTAYAHDVTIQDGAQLDASTSGSLLVYGDWMELGTGTFNATAGTVAFVGSGAQSITANAGSHFYHLEIGDGQTAPSVSLASDIDVDGDLTIHLSSSLASSSYTLYLAGDWREFGQFSEGTGMVVFDGTIQSATRRVAPQSVDYLALEAFEGSFPPTGWTRVDNTGDGHWDRNDAFGAANVTNGSGYSAASRGDSSSNTANLDNELWSPSFTIFAAGATLSYESNFQDYAGNGDAYLDISTDGGDAWETLTHWTADYGPTYEQPNLSAFLGETVNLRWRYTASAVQAWYWQIDDVAVAGWTDSVGDLGFYNLVVTGTTVATFDGNVGVGNDLTTGSGAIMDVGEYEITSVGGVVTNDGGLRQTQTAPNAATTPFLTIGTKYYGVDLSPTSGDMGATTVTVYGNQLCPNAMWAIDRCFDIVPTTPQTADITFYYRDAEEGVHDAAQAWHWNGSAWDRETLAGRDRSGAENNWVTASGVTSYSPFALANESPTAVELAGLAATRDGRDVIITWQTISEIDLLGFNVYRRAEGEETYTLLNETLIPAEKPGSYSGATYTWRDVDVSPGAYLYQLEDQGVEGPPGTHGPVSVTVPRAIYLPAVLRQ